MRSGISLGRVFGCVVVFHGFVFVLRFRIRSGMRDVVHVLVSSFEFWVMWCVLGNVSGLFAL